jgi:uncharacterized membrane protein
MSEGGRDRAQARSDTSRLETFADGVMAIAITLLILDVRVPQPHAGVTLGRQLLELWPAYAAYVTSFLTIGVIWVNHHRMFTLIRSSTHSFLMLNVVFLMVVAFLPFPTALVADYIRTPNAVRMATITYGITMIVLALMFNAVWIYASAGRRLLIDGVDDESIRKGTRSYRMGPVVYSVVTLLAFVDPFISLGLCAALAVYWLLPGSGPG